MKATDRPFSLRLRLSELSRPLLLPGGTVRLAVIPKFFNAFPSFLSKAALLWITLPANPTACSLMDDGSDSAPWNIDYMLISSVCQLSHVGESSTPHVYLLHNMKYTLFPLKKKNNLNIHSFIFSKHLILIRTWWIPSPSQEWEYTLDRTLVHPRAGWTHIFISWGNLV